MEENNINENIDIHFKDMQNGNKIIGFEPEANNTKIIFNGKNNILYCENNVKINKSAIRFNGDNSLVFLKSGNYYVNILLCHDSVVHIGKNNYFNPNGSAMLINATEHENIFIGDRNLFSFGIYIRTADPHLIYDIETKKRINFSKSIYIGDHVWFGQNIAILKGSKIHSGSVFGAQSVIANKETLSNSVYAENPIKKIKDGIFWDGACTHEWKKEMTQKYSVKEESNDIYSYNKDEFVSFDSINYTLKNIEICAEKLNYLKNVSLSKNRFTLV